MRQSKLTDQQRLDAVHAYLAGAGSYQIIAGQFGISARTLRDLVALYQSQGKEALENTASNIYYSPELKRRAVENYQNGLGSQRDICERYNIRARTQLRSWIKQFASEQEPFAPVATGGEHYDVPGRKTTFAERVEIVCHCLDNGLDYRQTIDTYHVSYQQIYSWVRKYRQTGPDGLLDRRGRPKKESELSLVERMQAEIKLLQAENHRLQVENTALKKLRHLERRWD